MATMTRVITDVLRVFSAIRFAAATPQARSQHSASGARPCGSETSPSVSPSRTSPRPGVLREARLRVGGDPAQNWLILQNETSTIGLFQGMFDKNMLTFNPGWDRTASHPAGLRRRARHSADAQESRPRLASAADESTSGPASLMLTRSRREPDPDRSARAQPGK